jgi:hypothetical protein
MASSILIPTRKQRTGKKRITSLEICRRLPYDLILEVCVISSWRRIWLTHYRPSFKVFAHLHPIDLYHLSQADKALRAILMTGHGFSLWKTAFRNHPSLPSCPPDLSEPRWTAMLFGPDICDVHLHFRVSGSYWESYQECGRHGALTDFVYRRRFCTECMKQKLVPDCSSVQKVWHRALSCVSRSWGGSKLTSLDSLVWELVPLSDWSGSVFSSFHCSDYDH